MRSLPFWLSRLLLGTALLVPALAASMPAQQTPVIVGVLSFRPKAVGDAQWRPLVEYLNRSVPEARFVLRIYSYAEEQEAVRQQSVDVLITQPAEYVRLIHQNGLSSPLATLIELDQDQPVRAMGGVILARSDRHDIASLRDLRGKRIAIPNQQSFGAYQVQMMELARAGVTPGELFETGLPQDLTMQAVLDGLADAGFVRTGLIEQMAREGLLEADKIKVLQAQDYPGYPHQLSTRLYPQWPVIAMPQLNEGIAMRIAGALLSVPQGSELARGMGLYGFATPADYEPVRKVMRELRQAPFDQPEPINWDDIWEQHRLPVVSGLMLALFMLVLGLRESWLRQRLVSFSNAMGEGMFVLDRRGRVTYINRAACRLLGRARETLMGRELLPLIVAPARASGPGPIGLQLDPRRWQQSYEGESVFLNASGKTFPVEVSNRPVHRKNRFLRSVTVFSDISERKAHSEYVYHLAYHDPLTGLPNRRLLLERLQESLGQRLPGQQGALLFSDLDRFKQLNDTLGHQVGDALLQAAAGRMLRIVGSRGTVARTGGDEFAVLLERLDTDPVLAMKQARDLADLLLASMREPFSVGSQYHQTSVSIGVALFDGPDANADELLKRADMAMYEAKAAGRNTIRLFDRDIAVQLRRKVSLESDLQQALAQQQFRVHYQPQFDGAGRLIGAEALLRWQHPERGLVSPGEFIPLAEETGLILPLGQWVLEQACLQIARWREHPELGHLVISVNLCAHQVLQANFVESVTAVLMATGADPHRLMLELTESVLARNVEDASEKMRRLVAQGVSFSLDDFGTGYSSLSYLKRLPIQQLKIDASFVRDLETDANDAAITQTVIDLGRSLGLEVIAEGVETVTQRNILQIQGCRLFQGYFYARPQAPEALAELFSAKVV